MTRVELEQKFVLDLRAREKIVQALQAREGDNLITHEIRQCYHPSGHRYRSIETKSADDETKSEMVFVKELKTGVKLGTSYGVSIEDDYSITPPDFEIQYFSSIRRRLQKTRYEVALSQQRTLMVDFFHTGQAKQVYAIVAEVETVLDATTKVLTLDFMPPAYLCQYILKQINDSDEESKAFKSINMTDIPESIENIERAYLKLYEQNSV